MSDQVGGILILLNIYFEMKYVILHSVTNFKALALTYFVK